MAMLPGGAHTSWMGMTCPGAVAACRSIVIMLMTRTPLLSADTKQACQVWPAKSVLLTLECATASILCACEAQSAKPPLDGLAVYFL